MVYSYLITAFRNIVRQRLYTIINVIGLATALTVCIFIFLFVRNELSYDTFFNGSERIYRVLGVSEGEPWGRVSIPWREATRESPGIESYTQLWEEQGIVRRDNQGFNETISFADSGFFDVFSFPMKYSDRATALSDIHSAVLSHETAEKLFGPEDPVGKVISVRLGGSFVDFKVSGVAQSIPNNSSIRFSVLIPYSNMKYTFLGMLLPQILTSYCGVSNLGPSDFVKLRTAGDVSGVENALHSLSLRLRSPSQPEIRFVLQPVVRIHLTPGIAANMQRASNPRYALILIGLGILILALSSINFVNLTIARASHRYKEIGVRKVLGASRARLAVQFLADAIVFSFLSLVVAVAATELFLPAFDRIAGKHLTFISTGDWGTLLGVMGIALLVGLISGLYPALYLSRFAAADVLKGQQKMSGKGIGTKAVMSFQFMVSAGLATCAVIMMEQMSYLHSKDLGYDKENIVVVSDPSLNKAQGIAAGSQAMPIKTFMDQISGFNGVRSVTCSSEMPGHYVEFLTKVGGGGTSTLANVYTVGPGYVRTLGLHIVAGRDFSTAISSDTTEDIIVNETLVRELGLKQPLGKLVECPYPLLKGGRGRIVGVVNDFNFESLDKRITPVVMTFSLSTGRNYVMVRLRRGDKSSDIAFLKKTWQSVYPGMPFDYRFLDDYLNSLYSNSERWSAIIDYSAGFAILVALMGLFGLTSYTLEKRTREFGIRKILGAGTGDMRKLIYREFVSLVILSSALACPAAWYFMHKWLQNFAYRIDVTIWPFLLASAAVLLATLMVTFIHVVRAFRTNPVEALRYE